MTLIGGIVGIVAAVVGIGVALRGSAPDSGQDEGGSHLENCMVAHGLERAFERTDGAPGVVLFRQCNWPPPAGADADGHSEIQVTSRDGPGESEAEGLTIADFIFSQCRDIEFIYLFNNQGNMTQEAPVIISKGEIRRVEGGSLWFPEAAIDASEFQPGRDQSIVLSNTRYEIDSARCI
ncbi:hypothetical protein ACPW96_19370 [Micromonospora sp. DT81.3]|uniref:hypothetical protein n=1 Tax=Micromonospora sp. DT81.3 TaxID=3416523 RepID=UPI003CE7BDAC